MNLNCQCCEKDFDWTPGFAVGRKPKYCPKCSNGSGGSYGIRHCKTCQAPFVASGYSTVNCEAHRRKLGLVRTVKCNYPGCCNTFKIIPNGSHQRKRCDIHRKGMGQPHPTNPNGCRLCGANIPKDRIDGYCSWQHNPDFHDADEYAAIKAQYVRKVG